MRTTKSLGIMLATVVALVLGVSLLAPVGSVSSAEAAMPSPLKVFGLKHKLTGKKQGSFPAPPKMRKAGAVIKNHGRPTAAQLRRARRMSNAVVRGGPTRHIEGNEGGYVYEAGRAEAWVNYFWSQMVRGYVKPPVYWGAERFALNCSAPSKGGVLPLGYYIGMNTAYSEYLVRKPGGGDMALAWLLAHEWGHAMQHLLGLRYSRGLYQELAADCFAGTWWKYMNNIGRLDTIAPGDGAEGMFAINALSYKWADPARTHGTYQERSDWNLYGYNYGVQACINAAR